MKLKVALPLLISSTAMNGFMAIAPILAEIQKSFPEVKASGIQLIYTIVSLFSITTMLLSGVLVNHFSKKRLMLAGLLLMSTGGVLPAVFHHSVIILYLFSAISGTGMGLFNILNSTLISDNFKGIEKGKMMGAQSAMVSIGGGTLSAASGFIAARMYWTLSPLVFLIYIPIILIVLLILPDDSVALKMGKGKSWINKHLIVFAVLNLLSSLCINVFQSNSAMFLEDNNLGNASVAGAVHSVFMIIGIPGGLSLGFFIKYLGRKVMGVSTLVLAGGMFMIAFSNSLASVYTGAILIGIGFSIRAPGSIMFAADMVSPNAAAMGIALNNAMGSIGNFISPIVINKATEMTNGGINQRFIISGVVLTVISLVYIYSEKFSEYQVKGFTKEKR
jgi:MFS family permease